MRIEVTESDVHRYSSEAEARAAHVERRARLFAKPAEQACVPLVGASQILAHQPAPRQPLAPLAPLVMPPEPTPLEKTMLAIVEAVASKMNLTAADVLCDLTSSTAQIARKISAAVAVRRLCLTPESVADVLGIVKGAVIDGLTMIDPVLREFAVPRTAPLADMVAIIFEQSRTDIAAPRPTIDEIRRVVAAHFKVSVADIMSARRTANVVKPRQIAIAIARHLTLKSLPDIGRRFGGRDHTTVLHAFRKYERAILLAGEQIPLSAPIIDWARAIDNAYERLTAS